MKTVRFASVAMCAVFAVSMAACGAVEPEKEGGNVHDCLDAPTGIPDYEADKDRLNLDIVGFSMPALQTEEQVRFIAEAGVTAMYIDRWTGRDINTEALVTTLELFGKYGIDGYVALNNGWASRGNGSLGNPWISVSEIITDYTQYPAFKGIMVFDEPGGSTGNTEDESTNDFAFLEREYENFKKLWSDGVFTQGTYHDYKFLVNLNADYKDVYLPATNRLFPMIEDEVVVSYDYYPLEYETKTDRCSLSEWYLFACEMFAVANRDHVKNNGSKNPNTASELWAYVQTTDFNRTGRTAETDGMLSEFEMRFQYNTHFAFGARGIELFVYGDTASHPGMIRADGRKTDAYEYVKNVNAENEKWAHVLMNFDWKGVMTVLGEKNTEGYNELFDAMRGDGLTESDRIRSLSATRDTLVGVFRDKNGYDGFMFVNFNDPFYRKSDTVTVRFNNATKAVVYVRGEREVVDLADGTLTYKLTSGDAAFVIPVV